MRKILLACVAFALAGCTTEQFRDGADAVSFAHLLYAVAF